MSKTKVIGIRAGDQLRSQLRNLKEGFQFESYAEMVESLARLLQGIDDIVCGIDEHPRNWETQQGRNHLNSLREKVIELGVLDDLFWRRLRERFGEDGVQHIRELSGNRGIRTVRKRKP